MTAFTPPANALLLAEALESGQFTQGHYALTRGNRDCCMGVACKVALAAGVKLTLGRASDGATTYDGESVVLPEVTRDFFGFESCEGVYVENDARHQSLVRDNDFRGHDFAQIARTIRTTPSLYRDHRHE